MIAYAVWNACTLKGDEETIISDLLYVHASEQKAQDWLKKHVSELDGLWFGDWCFSKHEDEYLDTDEYYVENLVIHEE